MRYRIQMIHSKRLRRCRLYLAVIKIGTIYIVVITLQYLCSDIITILEASVEIGIGTLHRIILREDES